MSYNGDFHFGFCHTGCFSFIELEGQVIKLDALHAAGALARVRDARPRENFDSGQGTATRGLEGLFGGTGESELAEGPARASQGAKTERRDAT